MFSRTLNDSAHVISRWKAHRPPDEHAVLSPCRQQLIDIINEPGLPPRALAITKPVVNAPQRARSFAKRPSTSPSVVSSQPSGNMALEPPAPDAGEKAAAIHIRGSDIQDEGDPRLSSQAESRPASPGNASKVSTAQQSSAPVQTEDITGELYCRDSEAFVRLLSILGSVDKVLRPEWAEYSRHAVCDP